MAVVDVCMRVYLYARRKDCNIHIRRHFNTCDMHAGMLYPAGDYDEAVAQINKLLNDSKFAEKVAQGGRAEVEKWGWGAATRVRRKDQCGRAIRNKRAHKRFGLFALRVALGRTFSVPIMAFHALYGFIVALLDNTATPFRARTV
jgi:aldehyde:ferredoxin oxidoreductase